MVRHWFWRGSAVVGMYHLCRTLVVCMCILQCLLVVVVPSVNGIGHTDKEEEFQDVKNELFRLEPCPSRCSPHNNKTHVRNNNNNSHVRIFYLILLHNERTLNDAVHLFRAIRHPRNIVVFHVDQKVKHLLGHNDSVLHQEIASCPCGSIIRMESIENVEWSKWSMNLPTLWGMQLAVSAEYRHLWDVWINLSADTMPVYEPNRLAHILHELPYNFVTSSSCETGLIPTNVYQFPIWWHKRRHYTSDETIADFTTTITTTTPTHEQQDAQQQQQQEQTTLTIQIHFGSQWVILQADFVQWFVAQYQDESTWVSQFRNHLQSMDKLMTDETFIPTVLMYSGFPIPSTTTTTIHSKDENPQGDHYRPRPLLLWANGTASDITDVRYERMDEHYPTSYGAFPEYQRYQVPDELLDTVDSPRVWGPYFLGVYDLGAIRQSGALFTRKVSAWIDANLVRILPVENKREIPPIYWPKIFPISITKMPDWSEQKKAWNALLQAQNVDEDDEEL